MAEAFGKQQEFTVDFGRKAPEVHRSVIIDGVFRVSIEKDFETGDKTLVVQTIDGTAIRVQPVASNKVGITERPIPQKEQNMGYYEAIHARSKKARDQMLAFMGEHYTPTQTLCDWMRDERGFLPPPMEGREVCAYARAANHIGWYRNAGWSPEDHFYASCLLRWMAIKIGKRKDFSLLDFTGDPNPISLPYTLYEHDPRPFLVTDRVADIRKYNKPEWDDLAVVDALGWKPSMYGPVPGANPKFDKDIRPAILEVRQRKLQAEPVVKAELQRLNKLWEQA